MPNHQPTAFRLPPDTHHRLNDLAKRFDVPRAFILRLAVEEFDRRIKAGETKFSLDIELEDG